MAEIKLEDIKSAAYDLIDENQEDYKVDDPKETLLYTLAFNDGVIHLLDKIESKFFPTVKGFDPREATDE